MYLEEVPWASKVNLYIVREKLNGLKFVAQPLDFVFQKSEPGEVISPTLVFDTIEGHQVLGELAKALGQAGFGAKETDVGELKATKSHLEDMRTLLLNPPTKWS